MGDGSLIILSWNLIFYFIAAILNIQIVSPIATQWVYSLSHMT